MAGCFLEYGLQGLCDGVRSGHPKYYGDEFKQRCLKKLENGLESTYKRVDTLTLFAALTVATGPIHGRITPVSEKTKRGF